MDKKQLRPIKRQQLKIFPKILKEAFDQNIFEQLKEILGDYQSVSTFVSTDHEIDTHALIYWLLSNQKKVSMPLHDHEKIIGMFEIKNKQSLIFENGYYTLANPKEVKEIDIAIIPLLAFNSKGYRLGQGKAMYDQWLSNFKGIKVGVAYDFLFEDFQAESWDIPLDMIVTETKILKIT